MESPLLLLGLLALLVAVPWLVRRYRSVTPDMVRVTGRTALHKNAVVAVVVVGERRLLVGAGEKGVQLLAELGDEDRDRIASAAVEPDRLRPAGHLATAPTDVLGHIDIGDHRDVVDSDSLRSATDTTARDALDGFGRPELFPTAGPGIGLVDRLRAMTVRTPVTGRPLHVPLRR